MRFRLLTAAVAPQPLQPSWVASSLAVCQPRSCFLPQGLGSCPHSDLSSGLHPGDLPGSNLKPFPVTAPQSLPHFPPRTQNSSPSKIVPSATLSASPQHARDRTLSCLPAIYPSASCSQHVPGEPPEVGEWIPSKRVPGHCLPPSHRRGGTSLPIPAMKRQRRRATDKPSQGFTGSAGRDPSL